MHDQKRELSLADVKDMNGVKILAAFGETIDGSVVLTFAQKEGSPRSFLLKAELDESGKPIMKLYVFT